MLPPAREAASGLFPNPLVSAEKRKETAQRYSGGASAGRRLGRVGYGVWSGRALGRGREFGEGSGPVPQVLNGGFCRFSRSCKGVAYVYYLFHFLVLRCKGGMPGGKKCCLDMETSIIAIFLSVGLFY